MCGRYILFARFAEVKKAFALIQGYDFDPSYNIAPTQTNPVVSSPSYKNYNNFRKLTQLFKHYQRIQKAPGFRVFPRKAEVLPTIFPNFPNILNNEKLKKGDQQPQRSPSPWNF